MTAVKLAFPGNGPGAGHIRAYPDGKKQSGPAVIVGEYSRASASSATWTVHLWSHPGAWTMGDERLFPRTLRELHEQLLERIKSDGPWWK